jgi:hypothetical protein
MKNQNQNQNQMFNELVALIVSSYGCNELEVINLIDITTNMERGAKYASLKEYCSNKSNNTELANHQIILNFSYENMKKDDKERLRTFDINSVDINKFNYDSIDLNGKDINTFKDEVRSLLAEVLEELKNPIKKNRVNNDIWINDMLVFNTQTEKLSLIGESVKKSVIIEGEFKKQKSVPKTIAKKLVKKQADLRSDKYRRYSIDNLNFINLQGENLEIQ